MKISILTAALNPGLVLLDCLASVERQKLPAGVKVEHLVLDGGSDDGTVPVLERWMKGAPGRGFRSRRDGGFYEALNHGIPLASGDVVGILNADDYYFDERVLARVAEAFSKPGVEGVYGDLVYVTGNLSGSRMAQGGDHKNARDCWGVGDGTKIRRYWKSGAYRKRDFWWGWMPPHPTIFVRRDVYARCGNFMTEFGTAADYEWIVRVMLKHGVPFTYIPHVLIAMREGGMSNRSFAARMAANRNDRRAWASNGITPLPWTFLLKPLRKLPQWFSRFRKDV